MNNTNDWNTVWMPPYRGVSHFYIEKSRYGIFKFTIQEYNVRPDASKKPSRIIMWCTEQKEVLPDFVAAAKLTLKHGYANRDAKFRIQLENNKKIFGYFDKPMSNPVDRWWTLYVRYSLDVHPIHYYLRDTEIQEIIAICETPS